MNEEPRRTNAGLIIALAVAACGMFVLAVGVAVLVVCRATLQPVIPGGGPGP